MSGNLIFIIFVLITIWRGVSAVIEKAAKAKEQERLRELAQRQPTGQGQGVQATPAPTSETSSSFQLPTQNPKARNRKEELATRRQAQLEELRRRRAGQGTSAKSIQAGRGQIRVGSVGSAPTPSSPALRSIGTPKRQASQTITRKADLASIHREQERQVQIKRQQQIQKQREAKAADQAAGQRHALNLARIKADREAFHHKAQRKHQSSGSLVGSMSAYGSKKILTTHRDSILHRMKDRKALREIFILKELLDPPLAMREPTD